MSSKNTNMAACKPLTRMTAAELAVAMKGAENIDFDDTKPLSPDMAGAWDRAKRGRGRPRVGEGAEKVLISMKKRLLLVTDALAKRKGLNRSKLVALAIREMLEREAFGTRREATTGQPIRPVTPHRPHSRLGAPRRMLLTHDVQRP